jgi:iron complex outermembrane recepter protein
MFRSVILSGPGRLGLLLFWLLWPLCSHAQVRGRVADAVTNEPLPGGTVRHGATGAVTDAKGTFYLPNAQKGDTLQFRCLGYTDRQVVVANPANWLSVPLEPGSTQLNEVAVTALQTDGRLLEVAGAVALLTPRELRRDNDAIIVPALNRVPGVFMSSGTLSTNRLTIRGIGSRSLFSTNKVRAYFNDIPLTTGDGETTIEDIDLSLVGRVEVVKGPSSSVYGAGLGGTVVLTGRRADYGKTTAAPEWSFGSFGLRRQVYRVASGSDRANVALVYSRQQSDGYRENNQYDRRSVAALGQFQAGERTQVSLLANYIALKAFIPSSIDSATFARNPRAAAPTWLQLRGYEDARKLLLGASVQHDFGPRWSNSTSIFATFRHADEPRPFNFLREASQAWGVRTRFVHARGQGWAKARFIAGGEYFDEWYSWRTYRNQGGRQGAPLSDQEERRGYTNLFAQAEADLGPRLTLTGGLNLNQTQYVLTDLFTTDNTDLSGRRSFDPMLSPRLAANFRPGSGQLALYATISHGFSPPTLPETLAPTGQINPAIRPETGVNYEAGVRGSGLAGRLTYDASYFYMDVRNLLVARRTGDDAFVGVNAGRTSHQGLEAALNYRLGELASRGWALQPFANLSLGRYRFRDFRDGDADYSGNPLTGTPPVVASAGLDLDTRLGLYASLNYQYVDAYPMRDDNTKTNPAYQLTNLRAGFRRVLFGHLDLHLYGGVANIFDQKYASMILVNATGAAPRYYYPGLPRNFFGGIMLGLVI